MSEIRRNPQTTICPIKGKSELTLRMATCFAPTTPNGGIQDSPFTSAAAEAHLKVYLKKHAMASDPPGQYLSPHRSGIV